MPENLNDNLEEAIQYAKKYLEDMLSFFGLNTDVYATTEDGVVIELNVPSTHLNGFLIGVHGDTMRSLQYITGTALKNQNFAHTRVNVDVADYKHHRAERLVKVAEEWFKEAQASGQPKHLQPMNAADRRVVHQAANDYGLQTESTGEGRDRHIILKPGELKAEGGEPKAKKTETEAEAETPKSETLKANTAKKPATKPKELDALKAKLEKPKKPVKKLAK